MSVIRTVPKESLFKEVSAKFYFEYQVAGTYAGQYVCTNPEIEILKMNINTFYLVDIISIAGSIPENVFVDSFNPLLPLDMKLTRSVSGEILTAQKMIISQYLRDHSISTHIECNRGHDGIKIILSGILDQVADTIGLDTISLNISISTYQIDGVEYNRFYRGSDLDKRMKRI